ncbi:GNAT family N-acetyltransferase [Actinoplanes sp. DH11]|uniref:GNAT family N-acetyltransferase n=1 Tax=Actinoplanes sp. DH11 TaxID=2857011 RepID=UPI001E2E3979|nr:GNAT family N-acetyltransferase [Actinoplanes sp. DH11]
MRWHLTTDIERFAEISATFLLSDPVRHTVFLTLIDTLRLQGPQVYGRSEPFFGWWGPDAGEVSGVLMRTPPHPLILSEVPAEAIPALTEALADRRPAAVNLLERDVPALTAGRPFTVGMRTRLHRLAALTPLPAAGAARTATDADRSLLAGWVEAFHESIGERPAGDFVGARLAYGGITLWEAGGVPVAMAARTRVRAGMARIQHVWTPPEHRRQGYGGAVTAAATRAALADGAADVALFTDVANPTSNALYQRLGYRPIEDRAVVEFSS